jgi:hypothetical protein
MTCDQFQGIIVGTGVADPGGRPDLAQHLAGCSGCRQWLAAYQTGLGAWDGEPSTLADVVLARAGGAACEAARLAIARGADEPSPADETVLLRQHVGRCGDCRQFEQAWQEIRRTLPALAEMEPDPWFAAAVLARTSRRVPEPAGLGRAWAIWGRLVRRPRFAWEVAYTCALCWVLFVGQPLKAYEWTATRVGEVARTAMPARVQIAQAHVQSLRETVGVDVSHVSSRIEGRREAARGIVRSAIQALQEWAAERVIDVTSSMTASWRSIIAWFEHLFSEPRATPAR